MTSDQRALISELARGHRALATALGREMYLEYADALEAALANKPEDAEINAELDRAGVPQFYLGHGIVQRVKVLVTRLKQVETDFRDHVRHYNDLYKRSEQLKAEKKKLIEDMQRLEKSRFETLCGNQTEELMGGKILLCTMNVGHPGVHYNHSHAYQWER